MSSRVTLFFKTAHSNESLLLAAKEASFAYHAAIREQSFKSSDCTSNLVSNFFEPTFAIARTKCESVIVNCISPMIAAELRQELDKVNLVSVVTDLMLRTENVKIVPVVVRYFLSVVGVKAKLLEFKSLLGQTAAIGYLANTCFQFLSKMSLKKKLLGFVQTTVTPTSEV